MTNPTTRLQTLIAERNEADRAGDLNEGQRIQEEIREIQALDRQFGGDEQIAPAGETDAQRMIHEIDKQIVDLQGMTEEIKDRQAEEVYFRHMGKIQGLFFARRIVGNLQDGGEIQE